MASLAARLFPMLAQLGRGRGAEPGPITLDRRRIYILPTRLGLIFAIFLLAMLIGSINYGLSLGYGLTFLLGGIAIVGILHTYKNLRGLRIADAGASPAFAGEEAVFHLEFDAPDPRYALNLGGGVTPVLIDVEGMQRVNMRVHASRRGRLRPGRFVLSTVYPLGLFRAWSYLELDRAAIVYPRPSETAPALLPAGEAGAGERPSARDGSDDFAGLRAWQPGDSPRQVAWKVAARSGLLATKRFGDVENGTLWLDWDSLAGLDVETRLSQLARWVLDAEGDGLVYGLRLPGCEIAPGKDMAHRRTCLEALALYEPPAHA